MSRLQCGYLVAATDRPNRLLLSSLGFDRLGNVAINMRRNCEQSFSSVPSVGKESDELYDSDLI